MMRNAAFAALGFFLGAVALAFGQATGLRPEQFIALPWTWTAPQTFGQVYGKSTVQAGGSYTFSASDCGTEVIFTFSGGSTATIPASIAPASGTTCNIAVLQDGAGKVLVNGSAVTPATLVSALGYTGTGGNVGAVILLNITTIGSTPTAILTGNGS